MSAPTHSRNAAAPGSETGGAFKKTFKAFQYHDFRIMWLGACTSSIGTWMQSLAQAWLVFELSKSSVYLGLDAFCAQIPVFLFSLLGGVFADRKSRRGLLLMSQFIQMASAFVLTALVLAKAIHVWEILCLSFVTGLAQAFGGPAYSALIPTLVGKEDIGNAISLNSIQFNLARVVGPALGGIALAKLGAAWCFGLNGISFIAVVITLIMIHPPAVPASKPASVLTSMNEGLNFIRTRDWMVALVVLAFLLTLLSFPLITFLPVVARDVLHGDANMFTLLLCVSGVGSITGALFTASLKQAHQARRSLETMVVLGAAITVFGFSHNVVLSCVSVFICGACLMICFASNLSVVQLYIGDAMRGRVMSVYNVAFRGGMPIGSLVCGLLIRQTSAPVVLIGNGILVAIAALYFIFIHRKLLKL